MRTNCLLLTVLILSIQWRSVAAAEPRTLRVYHVGNSVTDTINYEALKKMAGSRGHTHVYGRHMIPGAPLAWIYRHPDSGFKSDPFGYYPRALPDFEWDAVTLQPFDRNLDGDEGDVAIAGKFIDLALRNPDNAGTRFYVYSRWPRRDGKEPGPFALDYSAKWGRKYTGGWDGTQETRNYFERLTVALRDKHPEMKSRILMVPVGDVLLALDERMRGGKVAGFKGIDEVYSDGIHFNNAGSFIVGTVFFATLYGESPSGLSAEAYNVRGKAHDRDLSREFVEAVQETAWEVVRKHPMSGVSE